MRRLLGLALASAGLLPGLAIAQDVVVTGTLRTILDRGSIRIGVRDDAVPFSFRNRGGEPIGFSVDICRAIAAKAAAALSRDLVQPGQPDGTPGLRVVFVPLTADQRIPSVVSGAVDVECSSTTATAERARLVAFSPVFFLAGTKLLAGVDSGISGYRDLAGKIVAVSAGTTNAAVLARLHTQPPFTVQAAAGLDAAYAMLARNAAQAVASDDVLLAGLAATKPDGSRYRLVGDFLSFEPYAIAFRRDDPAFAATVGAAFEEMASTGQLAARYARWFTDRLPSGANLNLPMSAQLTEMYRALGQTD